MKNELYITMSFSNRDNNVGDLLLVILVYFVVDMDLIYFLFFPAPSCLTYVLAMLNLLGHSA